MALYKITITTDHLTFHPDTREPHILCTGCGVQHPLRLHEYRKNGKSFNPKRYRNQPQCPPCRNPKSKKVRAELPQQTQLLLPAPPPSTPPPPVVDYDDAVIVSGPHVGARYYCNSGKRHGEYCTLVARVGVSPRGSEVWSVTYDSGFEIREDLRYLEEVKP